MATLKLAAIAVLSLACADGSAAAAADSPMVDCLPGESCGAHGVTHDLQGTRWAPVRLGDELVVPGDDQREPFIALETRDSRVVGFGGCNRFFGGYTLNGERLGFTDLAVTLMECQHMQVEDGLIAALGATVRWRIGGAHLELLDDSGSVRARFEARDL
jgi:heat shock protein HslJ